MPKSPHHGGKGRRSRKSRRYAPPPAPMAARPPVGEASVSAARPAPQQAPVARSSPRLAPAAQQALLSYPHIVKELKTIGIITGGLIVLIIVLSVTL